MYVLWIVVCPFVLLLLAFVLSVLLRYTDSDCPFGIFKLFFKEMNHIIYRRNITYIHEQTTDYIYNQIIFMFQLTWIDIPCVSMTTLCLFFKSAWITYLHILYYWSLVFHKIWDWSENILVLFPYFLELSSYYIMTLKFVSIPGCL